MTAPIYEAGGDICLGFWKHAWEAGWCDFPEGARVLELGCAEADWQTPMLAIRPDLHITGIDVRKADRPGTIIQGDIFQQEFGEGAFDAIVAVSQVEWAGIGNYGDPFDEDGDRHEMALCHWWLKPDGWMYLDVPHRPVRARPYDAAFKGRAYTDAMVQDRIVAPHFREVRRRLFTAEEAAHHRDAPYIALLLRPV